MTNPPNVPTGPAIISDTASRGFNMVKGVLADEAIFEITYNKGQEVEWGYEVEHGGEKGGKQKIAIPDQFKANAATEAVDVTASRLMRSRAEYNTAFSASAEAKYSAFSFSAAVAGTYNYTGGLFKNASSSYALSAFVQRIMNLSRTPSAPSDAFLKAVKALPKSISGTKDRDAYFDFFDTYGTHVIEVAALGGSYVVETEVTSAALKEFTETQITGKIEAAYKGAVHNVESSAEFSKTEQQLNESLESSLSSITSIKGGHEKPTRAEWIESLYSHPSLLVQLPGVSGRQLTSKFTPISDLPCFEDKSIKDIVQAMLIAYASKILAKDGLLSGPIEKSTNRAEKNTFPALALLSTLSGVDEEGANYPQMESIQAESEGQIPTKASVAYGPVQFASMTSFARVGADNLVQLRHRTPFIKSDVKAYGIGTSSAPVFGSWEKQSTRKTYKPSRDGFVCATLEAKENENGVLVGYQGSGKDSLVAIASASAQNHDGVYLPHASLTMPVKKGVHYRVNHDLTCSAHTTTQVFLPIHNESLKLGDMQEKRLEVSEEAETDGFLLVNAHRDVSYGNGVCQIFSFPTEDDNELEELGLQTSIAFRNDAHDNKFAGYCSACVPIPKGNSYKIRFYRGVEPRVTVKARWFPLIPAEEKSK